MHLLAAASLKNRALIALVTIVASLFGLISVNALKQELIPSVQFPAIVVITAYPGASPEVVNSDVSDPIETALRGVPGLESSTATSSTGISTVLAQFTYGVDLPSTEQKVERAISRISRVLPDAVDPQVASGSIDDFPIIQIAITPPDGVEPEVTAELVDRIAIPELGELDGVREAQLAGARGDRVTITPDDERLAEEAVTAQSIRDALQQSGVLVAAGTVTEEDRTLAVQAGSTLESVDDIASLPLTRSAEILAARAEATAAAEAAASAASAQSPLGAAGFGTGGALAQAPPAAAEPLPTITIGDVATVALEQNPQQSISRVNGKPAVTIAVTKLSSANTVDVSHAVIEALPGLEESLQGASLEVIFDQAPYIEQSIETLAVEGLLGLVFAVLVILIFLLSLRATLVTAISIPVSVLLTFIGLNFAEYTLNLLTLGALTISIGRVVDDSIVVIENIKRHLAFPSPDDRRTVIVRAVREVAGAITASTVTTIAVFLPLAFVSGTVGELFRPFSFTVSIALAASLFVSLTIVPVLAYWFLRDNARTRAGAAARADELTPAPEPTASALGSGAHPGDTAAVSNSHELAPTDEEPDAKRGVSGLVLRGYRPVIDWTLKHPAVTLVVALLVFGGTIATAPLMKTNFIGNDEQNSVNLSQTLAAGTSLEAQLVEAERVEEALAGIPEVDIVQVTIGSGGAGIQAAFGGGDGVIRYAITTNPDASQAELQDEIRTTVEALDDAGEFSIASGGGPIGGSGAIEVSVSAPDQNTLTEANDAVVAALRDQDGLVQVESDLATSRPYLAVEVDRGKAADAGLSEVAVATIVAQQMSASQIGQIVIDATSIGVYLSQGAAPNDPAGVAALSIPTRDGEVRLDSLATVAVTDGPVSISTQDTVRIAVVSALPEGDDLGAAGTLVDEALAGVELPAGASADVGGVLSEQAESFEQLGLALLAAILIVYVLMVATFKSLLQPLLLLISVPFAATGAILLLVVTGIPLGVASLIGVLMLIGIVVTNAIVLIDLVNQLRDRGKPLYEAVRSGSLLRLRPIVMTALATILALVPMGLGITGKGGFISQPLAIVVIGGLLSSTVLTLVVLPTLYYAVERRREQSRERRRERRELRLAESSVAAPGGAPGPKDPASAPTAVGPADTDSTPSGV
ncbi:efflux RND transporter permease subunit [Leucobacter sp. W1478]|uniref:efflux RND transporter permease subunit n=1 Tax=Leucobacter sp. W1478 TaxID=3439065 RepID=UPI003F3B8C69